MSEGNPLINIGELSKPATVLIEKIAEAGIGLFRPWQIERVAKAEAEAALIKAKGELKATDLQRRALQRFIQEEAKKQSNMESIANEAIKSLQADASPEDISDDWMVNFFDKCRLISERDMQALWGKVLAGESNSPGSFSKRTVIFLASLDQYDAKAFQNICSFTWRFRDDTPLIYNLDHPVYAKGNVGFDTIKHLNEIGLISIQPVVGYNLTTKKGWLQTSYFSEPVLIESTSDDFKLDIGRALFSKAGQELAPICEARPLPGFKQYVVKMWRDSGINVVDPSVP